MRNVRRCWALVTAAILASVVTPAQAQDDVSSEGFDISGMWTALILEDWFHRLPGAALGDYTGIPMNDAARQKANSWDASVLSQPERQAQPHPAQYSFRGPGPDLRIERILDPETDRLIGYETNGTYGRADRTIWLDGREHPSQRHGLHKWNGFSTGEWVDGMLIVTTTHMKYGVYQRNGAPASPYGVMTEYWFRNGEYLTTVSHIEDPIYLEEPLVRSQTWRWNPPQIVGPPDPFVPAEEVAMDPGWVPHWPLGTQHDQLANEWGIPVEATGGGSETLYPEYRFRLSEMREGFDAGSAAAPGRRSEILIQYGGEGVPAQRPTPLAADSTEIEVLPVQAKIYLIATGGSNIAAQIGDDGAVLVDSGNPEASEYIIAALRELTAVAPRYVINTSVLPGHIGGNKAIFDIGENVARTQNVMGMPVVGHENGVARLVAGELGPIPSELWPFDTFYSAKKTIYINGESIEILHQPAAISDSDIIVYFRRSDVLVTGDIFRTDSYPRFYPSLGGSLQGVIDALNRIIDITVPAFNQQGGTLVIPGHGRISSESDIVEYRDMLTIIRDRVQVMIRDGLTFAQILAAQPSLEYDGIFGAERGPWSTRAFLEAVFDELSQQ